MRPYFGHFSLNSNTNRLEGAVALFEKKSTILFDSKSNRYRLSKKKCIDISFTGMSYDIFRATTFPNTATDKTSPRVVVRRYIRNNPAAVSMTPENTW